MTTYRQRNLAAGEARDDAACPDCGHRVGAHRGIDPITCIEAPDCTCQLTTYLAKREATR